MDRRPILPYIAEGSDDEAHRIGIAHQQGFLGDEVQRIALLLRLGVVHQGFGYRCGGLLGTYEDRYVGGLISPLL